jgi:predicted RNase H-like nuclease (RuvC/YqgF family)
MQLKIEAENFEQQEQAIVDHFANVLGRLNDDFNEELICLNFVANANSDIENLQEEIVKKNDENIKQQEEIMCLSYEMREIHRRLKELKKENEELKVLLSFTGKTRHEYETKVNLLLLFHSSSIHIFLNLD